MAFALEGFDAVVAELADSVSPRVLHAPRRLDAAARQVDGYLNGTVVAFDLPLDLRLAHGFRRDVLQHLRTIPYGRTESYTVAARGAGRPAAVRAAASACSHNPIPLVIPCHRVVRNDGSVGEYRGGASLKRDLLQMESAASSTASWRRRVDALDWKGIGDELDEIGCAPTGPVLTGDECVALVGLYDDDARFRSTVDMARHRFGRGEYRYFDRPLPPEVAALRAACWPHLLDVARTWYERLGRPAPWPDDLADWLAACHRNGQDRPTPLLLRYGPGDWNALHRDLYGDLVFPLQVVVGLDATRRRLHRRRVRRGRATTACPVPGHGHHHPARARRGLHHARPTGAFGARVVGRTDAPRAQHGAVGASPHARARLPRCRLNRTRDRTGSIRGATSTR